MKTRLLPGPRREVVYIFEREGAREGRYWLLVLSCGHSVTRRRPSRRVDQAMFQPLRVKLAPHHAECYSCGDGAVKVDPQILIKFFGAEVVA